jgi:hypothetical protein
MLTSYILSWSVGRLKNKNKFTFTIVRKHITTKIKPHRQNLGQICHTVFHEKQGTVVLVLSLEDKGKIDGVLLFSTELPSTRN